MHACGTQCRWKPIRHVVDPIRSPHCALHLLLPLPSPPTLGQFFFLRCQYLVLLYGTLGTV